MPKKGYKQSPEHLEKNRQARLGKHPTDETREKMRRSKLGERNHNFGKKFSESTRKKISESRIGEKNPLYGTHRPDHVKKAIGEAHRGEKNKFFGKPLPDEIKEKIRIATSGEKNHNYGKKIPESVRNKMSLSHSGFEIPLEVRVKMSASHQGIPVESWQEFAALGKYCKKWSDPELKIRKRVRAWYNNTCLLCGASRDGNHGKYMSVHHVTRKKNACCDGDKNDWLFATLCAKCHSKFGNDPNAENKLRSIISEIYGGKTMYSLEEYNQLFPNGTELDSRWGRRNGY